MIIFAFNDVTFSFVMSYTFNAFIDEAEIPFSREKVTQNGLKINGSVKTP